MKMFDHLYKEPLSSGSKKKQTFNDSTTLQDVFDIIDTEAAADRDACMRLLLQYLTSKPPRTINDEFEIYLKAIFIDFDELIGSTNSAINSEYGYPGDSSRHPLYPNPVHLSSRAASSSLVPKARLGEKRGSKLFRPRPNDDSSMQVVADVSASLSCTLKSLYCLLLLVRSAADEDDSNTLQTILQYNCSIDRTGKSILLYLKAIYEVVVPYLHAFGIGKSDDLGSIVRIVLSCFDLVVDVAIEMRYGGSSGAEGEDAWIELIALLADNSSGSSSDKARSGALVSDYFKLFEGKVVTLIGSSDDYFLAALRVPTGYLRPPSFDEGMNSGRAAAAAAAVLALPQPPPPSSNRGLEQQQEARQADIDTLKSLFPEYKDLFLGACLAYFDWHVERAADALLTDNIPEHLRLVDTNVVRVSSSKGSGLSANAGTFVPIAGLGMDLKNRGEILPTMTSDYKRREKERLRLMEKQEEDDRRLIEREYDDDYDDQYDNPTFTVPAPTSGVDNSALCDSAIDASLTKGKKGKKEEQSAGAKINWEVRMRETKRINALIRKEEENIAYWRDMRVDNVQIDGDEAAKEEENADKPSDRKGPPILGRLKAQGQTSHELKSAHEGEKKKHRTKTFDKHHQKDKANRKFS